MEMDNANLYSQVGGYPVVRDPPMAAAYHLLWQSDLRAPVAVSSRAGGTVGPHEILNVFFFPDEGIRQPFSRARNAGRRTNSGRRRRAEQAAPAATKSAALTLWRWGSCHGQPQVSSGLGTLFKRGKL